MSYGKNEILGGCIFALFLIAIGLFLDKVYDLPPISGPQTVYVPI